jgi:hypothetical protein
MERTLHCPFCGHDEHRWELKSDNSCDEFCPTCDALSKDPHALAEALEKTLKYITPNEWKSNLIRIAVKYLTGRPAKESDQ